MTLFADDPDVHVIYPITVAGDDAIDFTPIVKVQGFADITGSWVSDIGPTRDLRVPLVTLSAGAVHRLRLVVPGDNDVVLGDVVLATYDGSSGGGGTTPPAAGTTALIVSAGGVVDLNNALPDGSLVGYRFTGAATVEGVALTAGTYVFERDTTRPSGWSYRTVAAASALPVPDGGGGEGPVEDVEVTPQAPTWDDAALGYTIASTTGVQYKLGGSNMAPGFHAATAGTTVTITATPQTGYVFPGGVAASWDHEFPASGEWSTSFTDTLLSPQGDLAVRTGWVLTPNTGTIGIDATSAYVTGSAEMKADNPGQSIKHFVEFDYGFNSWDAGGGIGVRIAYNNWGGHDLNLSKSGNGEPFARAGLSINGTVVSNWGAAEPGVDLADLPGSGRIRAETDGTYIHVYLNDSLILSGLRSDSNNPAFDGPANKSRVSINGIANTTSKFRLSNVVMGIQ